MLIEFQFRGNVQRPLWINPAAVASACKHGFDREGEDTTAITLIGEENPVEVAEPVASVVAKINAATQRLTEAAESMANSLNVGENYLRNR